MATEKKLVKVSCNLVNGLTLTLWKKGFDDGSGHCPNIPDGPSVSLAGPSSLSAGVGNTGGEPVVTEVDAEWMAKWMEQNKTTDFVELGYVKLVDEGTKAKGRKS